MSKRRTGAIAGGTPLQWRDLLESQQKRVTGGARPRRNDEKLRQRKTVRLRDALRTGLNGPDARDFDIKKVLGRLETRR